MDKKIEKRDIELTKSSKNGTKQCRPPPNPPLGHSLQEVTPWGQGKKLPQTVSSFALVVHRMVGKDGTGKRQKTSKGLRGNKTVCKSCLNMFIFSMPFIR